MSEIIDMYIGRSLNPTNHSFPDIGEHLPLLKHYAEQVRHITEIGTRTGNSTTAFLAGLSKNGGEMHSYDIDPQNFYPPKIDNVTWVFHHQDTQSNECLLRPTELLFIDGSHTYIGVTMDLRFAHLASRFIIMHDTAIAWCTLGGRGVYDALAHFLAANVGIWAIKEQHDNCNGITVLERL